MTQTVLQRQIVATASAKLSSSETLSLMEGVKFFAPTLELTKEIVLRVEQERNKQLEKVRQDPTQVEEISAQDIEASSTVESITGLFWAGFDEIKKLSAGLLGQTDSNPQAWQKMMCQEFYHHLTFLIDSPAVAAGEAFSMQKVVAQSMGNLLGLSKEDELLTKLANEFADWLETQGGQFTAGWGKIILADQHRFYLEKFHRAEAEETEQPVGFAITVHGRSESAAVETDRQAQAVK